MKNNKKSNLHYLLEKNKFLFENEIPISKEEKKAFLESIKSFSKYKNEIYRSTKLKEVSKNIGALIESAEQFTLKETGEYFDQITVNRHMKRIKESYKIFEKTCNEMTQLQQRLEAAYDDIGTGLSTYYDLGDKQ
jgi:hypothetical protein